jgi:hypothetical protein
MVFRGRAARAARPARATAGPGTWADVGGEEETTLLPGAPLGEEVFVAAGAVVTFGDVRDWMVAEGSWAAAARRAAEGRALALAQIGGPSGDVLRQAAQRFRRERKLIAGEDLSRWLAHWGISEEEWVDWLDGTLRREAQPGVARPESNAGEHETWVETVCSGALRSAARQMARAFGAWAEQHGGAQPPAAERFAATRGAYDALVGDAPERSEVERIIATNALGWLQIAYESADFGSADAAREALASVRDDGETLASVATLAGAELETATVRAEDLAPHLRSVLVSAPLDGPVLAGGPDDPGVVVVVRGRRHPTIDDPDDAALAAADVAEQRVQTAMDRWVSWRA